MVQRKAPLTTISARAKSLLEREEGFDVEFKQSAASLDASDVVAFANSANGGAILLGVREEGGAGGRQIGTVIGCDTSDKAKLQILDKALSCQPPVPVELFVENTQSTPFFRLEIPSGLQKPYGTSGGTYKTREDGRVRALTPSDLLALLMEKEAQLFDERFRKATTELVNEIKATAVVVSGLNKTIKSDIENISSTLGWTDMKVDDTASDIGQAKALAAELSLRTKDIEARLVSLLAHTKAPDPVKAAARATLVEQFGKEFKKKPELLSAIKEGKSVSLSGPKLDLFSKDEVIEMILEAAKALGGEGA